MNKVILVYIFSFIFLFQVKAQNKIAAIFSNKILHTSSYSYYAIDAATGKVLLESPQKSLVPASVMKIVTTAAAIEIFGPEFRFRTILGYTGTIAAESGILKGNLVIKGGGDPAFYSRYFSQHYKGTFEEWAEKIREAGIKIIKGNLVVDISAMEHQGIPGSWIWEDIGNYYGTGVSAMNFFDNLYEIHFKSPADEGKPVNVLYTEPPIEGLNLENKVLSSKINLDLACVYAAPQSYQQVVMGTIPSNRNDYVVKAATPDPAITSAAVFRKVLSSKGIVLEGKILTLSKPGAEQYNLLAEKLSPPLKELIVPLNQKSLNLFAEQLLREIGRAKKNDTSLGAGIEALNDFWKSKGIFMDGFSPSDGSGLSRSNTVCSRTIVDILSYMYKGSNRDYFFNSLPLAGVNGTLQYSFTGSPLANNLRAKTGSMKRIKSIAGMFTGRDGKEVIFSLIINNFDGDSSGIGKLTQDFVKEMYNNVP